MKWSTEFEEIEAFITIHEIMQITKIYKHVWGTDKTNGSQDALCLEKEY